jgi:hypothetical protein
MGGGHPSSIYRINTIVEVVVELAVIDDGDEMR